MSRPITGLLGGADATFEDYERLFNTDERPEKFSAREAGFLGPARRGMPTCGSCIHWFMNPQTKRTVCEVVRLPHEANIRASSTCRFETEDGRTYPLLHVL